MYILALGIWDEPEATVTSQLQQDFSNVKILSLKLSLTFKEQGKYLIALQEYITRIIGE